MQSCPSILERLSIDDLWQGGGRAGTDEARRVVRRPSLWPPPGAVLERAGRSLVGARHDTREAELVRDPTEGHGSHL